MPKEKTVHVVDVVLVRQNPAHYTMIPGYILVDGREDVVVQIFDTTAEDLTLDFDVANQANDPGAHQLGLGKHTVKANGSVSLFFPKGSKPHGSFRFSGSGPSPAAGQPGRPVHGNSDPRIIIYGA